jgi:hypothetical protein
MRTHAALDHLIDLEERAARLYIHLYRRFADAPTVGDLWWEMALEEHEHAGTLKMVKELTDPKGQVPDIRPKLRLLQALIRASERTVAGDVTLRQALAVAVRLERSELDRIGRETMRTIGRDLPLIPRSVFAPHEAHLDRLMRIVRKFGGEEVTREAWALTPEARRPMAAAAEGSVRPGGRAGRVAIRPPRPSASRAGGRRGR